MDLRLLRYFLAVVDAGSVSAASREVRVAQPSLSRQVRRLELDLGLILFDRSGKSLQLSQAGQKFEPVARDLLHRAVQAQAAANSMSHGTATRLTVVAAPTTSADIISPYIVHSGSDGRIVNVVEASSELIYGALLKGDADFAIGTHVPPADLESRVVGNAYLWAQFPVGHPLAGAASITLTELIRWPLIVMSEGQGVRRMFDSAVTRAGLSYTAAFETESAYVAQALAAAGRGVCILSDDSRFDLITTPIASAEGELIITLFGVWDPVHYASPTITDCLDDLGRFIAHLYPQRAHDEPHPK